MKEGIKNKLKQAKEVIRNPKTTIKKVSKKIDDTYEKIDHKLYNLGDTVTKDIPKAVIEKPVTTAAIAAPGGSVLIATGISKKGDKISKAYKGESLSKKVTDAADNEKTLYYKLKKGLNNAAKGMASISRTMAFSDKITKNMTKYRESLFTIPEGHYTGPKDIEEVPGTLKVVGGATIGGAILGAGVGHVLGQVQDKFDSDYKKGAKVGAGAGFAAGVAAKVLLNVMHNPMTTVKFNEVDKTLRRNFGIYSAGGFVVGDSRDNRKRYDEAFAINDREITNYRINVVIQDNQVILYTFQLSDQELKRVSDSLDYFCKKYYGMNYNSKVIDAKINSYSVTITFTNYQVISDFLTEISEELHVKINLLNNKAIVELRLVPNDKSFSELDLSNQDLLNIIVAQGVRSLFAKGKVTSEHVISAIKDTKDKMTEYERVKIFGPSKRKDFDNAYLLGALGNLRFKEGKDYTVDISDKEYNMSLFQGVLTIAVPKNSKAAKDLEAFGYFNETDVNKSIAVYTYSMRSKQELNTVITRVINTRIVPNIYTGSL